MTIENQTILKPSEISVENSMEQKTNHKMNARIPSSLEDRKGNSVKPLSLRPIRSVKKNSSLKPLGLRSR